MTRTICVTIDGHEHLEEVARFERGELQAGNLGLSLAEAKSLLATVQRTMVAQQISAWGQKRACCEACAKALRQKGLNKIVLRTVFGKLKVDSPRLFYCSCQGRARASFSPLAELLPERTAPELRYLQTKWASLMSYGMTVDLLKDVLPVSDELSAKAIRSDVERAAQRLESELGDERDAFIEGTPADWQDLPDILRITVGVQAIIKSGNRMANNYVRRRDVGPMQERMQVAHNGACVARRCRGVAKAYSGAIIGTHTRVPCDRTLHIASHKRAVAKSCIENHRGRPGALAVDVHTASINGHSMLSAHVRACIKRVFVQRCRPGTPTHNRGKCSYGNGHDQTELQHRHIITHNKSDHTFCSRSNGSVDFRLARCSSRPGELQYGRLF